MTNYSRGTAFERKVADSLTLDGYHVVRAAGSRGHEDLVAIKRGQVLLVQCKLGGPGEVGPAEWNELYNVADLFHCVPIVASRPKRGVVAYHLMTGLKTGVRGVRPPCVEWTPDELYPSGAHLAPPADPPPSDAAERDRPAAAHTNHGARR